MKEKPQTSDAAALEDSVVDIEIGSRAFLTDKMLQSMPLRVLDFVELLVPIEGSAAGRIENKAITFPAGAQGYLFVKKVETFKLEIIDEYGSPGWCYVEPKHVKVIEKYFGPSYDGAEPLEEISSSEAEIDYSLLTYDLVQDMPIEVNDVIEIDVAIFDPSSDEFFPAGTQGTLTDVQESGQVSAITVDDQGNTRAFTARSGTYHVVFKHCLAQDTEFLPGGPS